MNRKGRVLIMEKYDLHCDFDIQQHKKNYINYLEVVIDSTGCIMYAVPSHQQKLIALINISTEELWKLIPVTANVMDCLCEMANCIAVWNDFYIGKPNEAQKKKLFLLKTENLYKGKI